MKNRTSLILENLLEYGVMEQWPPASRVYAPEGILEGWFFKGFYPFLVLAPTQICH
jgi:hypothetical protein